MRRVDVFSKETVNALEFKTKAPVLGVLTGNRPSDTSDFNENTLTGA